MPYLLAALALHLVAVLWTAWETRRRRHPQRAAILWVGIASFFFLPGIGAAAVIAWTFYDPRTRCFTRNPPVSRTEEL